MSTLFSLLHLITTMSNDLRELSSLRSKYAYEPYDPIYPELYEQERVRLIKLDIKDGHIYHIGSTSIPGVGGKGVIDILITVDHSQLEKSSRLLIKSGYEFRESGGDLNRLFHQKEYEGRRYHVHISPYNTSSAIQAVAFRDYLRTDPDLAKAYSNIKKEASFEALKQDTKEMMKQVYAQVKAPLIEKILAKVRVWINDNIDNYSNI